jgi:hypothetical protein
MDRNCNSCGALNREEAKFCKSCGSPLPVIKRKLTQKEIDHEKQMKKFWLTVLSAFAACVVVGILILGQVQKSKSIAVAKEYTEKYLNADDRAFGTIKPGDFLLEGMSWKMSLNDIKRNFSYATVSNDPDFKQSMMISQAQFLTPIPHANFMSLGIYNGMLYAVKFEFGENEKFETQQFKVPNKDEILYGRFMGLYTTFKKLFGEPVIDEEGIKLMELSEKLKTIKSGTLGNGKPSNVYVAWNLNGTKAELAFFGFDDKLHLTVRFLNMPLWNEASAQPAAAGSYRSF